MPKTKNKKLMIRQYESERLFYFIFNKLVGFLEFIWSFAIFYRLKILDFSIF